MLGNFRLYFKLVRIAFQSRMQYRADFITGVIGVITMNVAQLGLIGILVSRFQNLNGWSLWQMVFLYCMWMLGHSIFSLFFFHIRTLEEYLVQGTFDQFLIRPASAFVLFIGREIQYIGIGDLTFGAAGLALAYINLGLQWNGMKWLFFVAAILAGTLIEMTLTLMVACIAFWTGRSRRANSFMMQINVMIQHYPVDIFGYIFRIVVTGLIPVAFMNYYPSLMLLGKINYQVPFWWLAYMSPVVAVLMVGIANRVWTFALDHYSSSGG